MADVRTNVVISAETKGFDKALRQTLGVNEAALKGLKGQAESYKSVQKEVKGYQGKLDDLSKTQLNLSRSMEAMGDKGSEAYSTLKQGLRDVTREARDTERVITNLEKAYRKEGEAVKTLGAAQKKVSDQQQQDARQARGAFTQGLIQAGAPGMAPMFMQRGPGMRRQAAGMMAGGLLRRGIGGAGAAAFGGLQGMQQALSAIPGVGGFLAGQLGTAAGFAGQELQYQRQRVEAAPFVGATGPGKEVTDIRRELRKFREGTLAEKYQLRSSVDIRTGERVQRLGGIVDPESKFGQRILALRQKRPQWQKLREMGETPEEYRLRMAGRGVREGRIAERLEEARKLTIGGMGARLRGISEQEAMQETAAISQAAGEQYTGRAGQRRFMETAMAAQTAYGLGPGVTGAFGMGARRGGLVGGRDRGAESMTEALADAVTLGLSRSETQMYMQQVAQGIQQFQQTGIPFNKDSLSSMATALGRGMASTRAMRVAGGVQQYVQGIGARGPAGGLDLMAMQAFGGYRGGGGAEELERSFIQMEEMGGNLREKGVGGIKAGSAMGGMMRRIMEMGGGGAGGRLFLRKQLGRMGVQVGAKEMSILGKTLTGEELTKTESAWMAAEERTRTRSRTESAGLRGPRGLAGMAEDIVAKMGPNLATQASLMNQQKAVGKKLLGTVQTLQQSAINTNTAFADLAAGPLKKVSEGLEEFTAWLASASKEKVMETVGAGVDLQPG